jgi:tetratricopeptide (TPR) repeat protein
MTGISAPPQVSKSACHANGGHVQAECWRSFRNGGISLAASRTGSKSNPHGGQTSDCTLAYPILLIECGFNGAHQFGLITFFGAFMRFAANGPNFPDELLIARDEGRVVFFCGSGVSLAKAGLRDFIGLARDVADKLSIPADNPARQLINAIESFPPIPGVGSLIAADRVFGLIERDYQSRDIYRAIAASLKPDSAPDLSAHRVLLDLARGPDGIVRLITTNFDLLFEDCDPTAPVSRPPHLPDPLRSQDFRGIIHLHGQVTADYSDAAGDGLIISSGEFGRAYLSDRWAADFIKTVLERFFVVFVGYHLAYTRYVAGHLTQAKPLLDAVVVADPGKDEAWTILGLIAKKTGDLDGEVAMYRRAIEANPRSALALVNLASRAMLEDAVKARNYLKTAIYDMAPDSPHYACALHLMGNSYAYIEKDYLKEIEYHKKAVSLEPTNPLYRDNLVLALLSAGRSIDARRLWRETKQIPSAHPLVKDELIAAFCDESLDPREYLVIVDVVGEFIGAPGRRVLLNRAWRRRSHIEPAEQLEFLSGLATMASQAGDDELALQAWRDAASFDAEGALTVNEAVALDRLGRTSEALTLIESRAPAGERFHTILGNIRNQAGLRAAAIEAYRKAVETEPPFVLPFLNAFRSIEKLREPSLAEPFVSALMERWEPSPRRSILLAEGHLLAGRPATAADFALEALVDDGTVIPPEDVHSLLYEPDDPSLFVSPSADIHKLYALALLRSKRFQQLSELVSTVFDWPRWADGDWRILNAEIA